MAILNSCSIVCKSSPNKFRVTRQLEILALRSIELADQVAAGELPFLDTLDAIYEAAWDCGLVEIVGDRIVQATMAAAFANARRPVARSANPIKPSLEVLSWVRSRNIAYAKQKQAAA